MLTFSAKAACGLLTGVAEWSSCEYAADCCCRVLINFSIITNTWGFFHKSYMAGAIAEVQGNLLELAGFSWGGSSLVQCS